MREPHVCPRCRTPLAADAPLGLCPECLLREGFESRDDAFASPEATAASPSPGFTPPSPTELAASFPQLEIQELLGHGGMGAVYRARQKSLDRVVALKILPPKISGDPAFAERFQREARTLARLNHPNIVIIYEFGKANGYYYLLMEYVDGVNLRQAIQAKTLGPAEALAVVPLTDADGGGDGAVLGHLHLALGRHELDGPQEAGGIARGEELFRVVALAAGAAQFLGGRQGHGEGTVGGPGAAGATTGGGGLGGV